MTIQQLIIDVPLFILGAGALLWAYLAFSPMTRDLVVFLSRDAQINIFRYRKVYWSVGILGLSLLLLRALAALSEPGDSGVLAAIAGIVGRSHWIWLVLGGGAAFGIGMLYWAMYVPVVMAPPRNHRMVNAKQADSILDPESVVLGIEMDDEVRAYPRDLIARPHWFNDEINGKPLMVSYCILCNSGQAFIPVLRDGRRLDLRNMTAYDNNTIYHCMQTGNFIQQLDGRIIKGPDEGEVLTSYPVVMARWGEWKRLHPDTKVYYAPPVTVRDRIVQGLLMKMIPLKRLASRDKPWHLVRKRIDDRLPAMSFVFGVEINGDYCAYPVELMKKTPVVNDQVGGEDIAVFYDATHDIGQAFLRTVKDQSLSFEKAEAAGSLQVRDQQTGSIWNVSGLATAGPLEGHRLTPAPHWNQLFWFSWAAFKTGTRVYDPAASAATR